MNHIISEDDQFAASQSDDCESNQQSYDDSRESNMSGWDEGWGRRSDESTPDGTNEELDSTGNRASDIESVEDLN
jgi:hypothetical protein